MAYSSNLKIWDLNNTNIASSSSADGKSFAVGAPIISTDFNGILKDVSLVTACLVKALINTATTSGDTFVFDNILTSESDIVDAFEYLLTYKDQVNISDLGANGITAQTIVVTSSTSPSQGTAAANKNGAIKVSNGGIYAKKSIRSDESLIVDEIKAATSNKAITIHKGIHFVNDQDEVILSPESGATQATLYLPDKQGETLATTADITAALNPISSTVDTLKARALYEHNIFIQMSGTIFAQISIKLLTSSSSQILTLAALNDLMSHEYIVASGIYTAYPLLSDCEYVNAIFEGSTVPAIHTTYYDGTNWTDHDVQLTTSGVSVSVGDNVVTIYTAIS